MALYVHMTFKLSGYPATRPHSWVFVPDVRVRATIKDVYFVKIEVQFCWIANWQMW